MPYYCNFNSKSGLFNNQRRDTGSHQLRFLAVSFGLLCVLQAALNISLRLAFGISLNETSDAEAILKNVTKERDELERQLAIIANYSQQGWQYFNGSFYFISTVRKSWQESREDCLQRGADLVIINKREEGDYIRNFHKHLWIGLTDSKMEGFWEWVDGTPLNTSYWGPHEPNSHKGTDEDCAEIKFFTEENSWNDKPCAIQNVWACEKRVIL